MGKANSAKSARKEILTQSLGGMRATDAEPQAATPFGSSANRDSAVSEGIAHGETRHDVLGLKALLEEQFAPQEADRPVMPDDNAGAPDARPAGARRWVSKSVKTVVGLAVIVIAGWVPAEHLLQVSSAEAVVNAPLVSVRAPIGGVVEALTGNPGAGDSVNSNDALVAVVNPRADGSQVAAAADRLSQLEANKAATSAKLGQLQTLGSELQRQVSDFRRNMTLRTRAEIAGAEAQASGAAVALEQAKQTLDRRERLAASGVTASSDLEKARNDVAIARETLAASRAARQALAVELDALLGGSFLGDGYNDRPQSAQKLDDVRTSIASSKADLATLSGQIASARTELAEAKNRFALDRRAVLAAPARGTIWQVLARPGEHVVAGQPLMNIVDCAHTIVTAAVSEGVYNKLLPGTPATFALRDGGKSIDGRVVQLNGLAEGGSNLAVAPALLTRQPYRVGVMLDRPLDAGCQIGQTGRVVFHPAGR